MWRLVFPFLVAVFLFLFLICLLYVYYAQFGELLK